MGALAVLQTVPGMEIDHARCAELDRNTGVQADIPPFPRWPDYIRQGHFLDNLITFHGVPLDIAIHSSGEQVILRFPEPPKCIYRISGCFDYSKRTYNKDAVAVWYHHAHRTTVRSHYSMPFTEFAAKIDAGIKRYKSQVKTATNRRKIAEERLAEAMAAIKRGSQVQASTGFPLNITPKKS